MYIVLLNSEYIYIQHVPNFDIQDKKATGPQ